MDALRLAWEGGVARIGGFIPFDVWAAQELGALERGKETGEVPTEYAALPKALADANGDGDGDGRVLFTPKAGEATARSLDTDEDKDKDEETSTGDGGNGDATPGDTT